ncbi:transposase, mutator family [mine drainage metagenome]|uniref:Transposase, mutator family n=1 Tax=mine drainage metagenome TaxID=410659 RepID=A0A1J5Q922_9ZZZZ
MGLQTEELEVARDAALGDAGLGGHRAHAPMRRAVGRLGVQRGLDQVRDAFIVNRARLARPHVVVQPGDAAFDEPLAPFDALRVKIREDGVVRNKAIDLALGVLRDGTRDILGMWIENTEGAKFWMKVFNDLKTRGVADILIAVTDGLKGMPEALGAVYPATTLQTCIMHLIRNSLDFASWKDRKLLAAAIKPIYTATSAEAAQAELDAFEQGPWGQKFPTVVAAWRRAWDRVIPFFAFPPAVRRVIYTTNAIESINARLRFDLKTRGHFPSDDAAAKLIWLALRNITADWGCAAHNWKEAMNQFAILYAERFTKPIA